MIRGVRLEAYNWPRKPWNSRGAAVFVRRRGTDEPIIRAFVKVRANWWPALLARQLPEGLQDEAELLLRKLARQLRRAA